MEQEKTSHTDYRGRDASDQEVSGQGVSDQGVSVWDRRGQQSSNQVDRGQVGVIVLIVLAVVATVVMLLSNSEVALRLALLASLWSAVIGFFLVTRYRRQAQSAEQRVADHERFVRQQQESAAAQAAGQGVSTPQSLADAGGKGIDPERFEQMWESIRAELTVIRTHLEELQDREFGYEPAALQAEARRIRELEQHADHAGFSAGYGASSGAPSRDAIAGKLGSQPSQPQPNPLSALISEREQEQQQRETDKPKQPQTTTRKTVKPAAAKPTTAKPASRKPAAETAQSAKTSAAKSGATISAAAKTGATKSDSAKQNQARKSGAGQAADRDTGRSTDPVFDTSRFHAARWDSTGQNSTAGQSSTSGQENTAGQYSSVERDSSAGHTSSEKTKHSESAAAKITTQQPQPAAGAHQDDAEARPHRRRRDENTEGISVAELLKRTQK
ncbi:hypothetical protein NLL45_07195 [Corynebacterium propinquum]|uniref:DUF6779 domain-containing protein n=1 Tax=Corynebacterium propinquum TaxID=43769 RepID=UPI00266F16BC|nr:DUF6779 domain-containing protein [Corynebacterium propinquum]WKS31321.1 hypothetical protein NLL45_07195 [Corynebacterium propinquum]WKS35698.1 hypothetical protein NLL30_07510 [Corynebacterium propinquum]WKS37704.1 hypothetical protein NLL34_06535 [Corynebacterium propinquum]WKS41939.1 hypothetical protein NLL42_06130 [Corynebacterium propinquum]WKS48104.1 hypothetical protein NLL47_05430 [Corynebacterium propinquum]